MNISLIQCPGWGRDCPPYTLSLLSSLLRDNNHNVFTFDLNNTLYLNAPANYRRMWDDKDLYSLWSDESIIDKFIEDNKSMIEFQVNRIMNTDSKLIGFTVHFTSLLVSFVVAEMIKKLDKSKFIVFGGPECSIQQKGMDIIEKDIIDAVSTGEGDLAILELVKELKSYDKINSCKGLLWKDSGKIINGGPANIIDDLDDLPVPDYSDFKEDIFSNLYKQPNRLEIYESRGCFVRCHFCSEWQFWQRYRSKSGERLYDEIISHINLFPKVNYFYFLGSLLNGDIKSLNKFCELVINNNLNIKWSGQAIIRQEMTKSFFEKMKKAGCKWLSFGIESGSQRVINNMNKKFSVKTAEQVLKNANKSGIEIQANFMFGFPEETEEDFKKTLSFVKRNRSNIDSVLASQSFCVIDKGTYLHENSDNFGIQGEDHHLYWKSDNGKNIYPDRFRKYEKFCNLALSLGLPETSGVLKKKPDKYKLLGDYYLTENDYSEAMRYYEKAIQEEFVSESLFKKLDKCYKKLGISGVTVDSKQKDFAEDKDIIKEQKKESVKKSISVNKCNKNEFNYNELENFDSMLIKEKLNYLKEKKFKVVELSTFLKDIGFNTKQIYIANILYKKKIWDKLSNFILVELQKRRRDLKLIGYPYWLVVDPTNFCNLKCPFCPTGQHRNARIKQRLSFEKFKSILDKIGDYLIHIDFCNWGEPFLNEEIFKIIKYAKKFDIDTKVDTNLHFLGKEKIKKLLDSGLDKLIVSIDGVSPETYSKYRVGGDYNRVMRNLKSLLNEREKFGSRKPFITWQFLVFKHNEHEIKKVEKLGYKMGVDEVGITKAFIGNENWIPKNNKYSRYEEKQNYHEDKRTSDYFKSQDRELCNWPWDAMAVNPNGSVSPCCSVEEEKDDFGNIFKQEFEELWNNRKYKTARKYIKDTISDDDENICIGCKHSGMINVDLITCHNFSNFPCSGVTK